jgi:hypothetical protein
MANQRLNIDIVARDKSTQALNNVQSNLSKVKSAIFNLQNAFIGLGTGLALKSLVNTGKEIEGLKLRLKFLFGSVKEGNRAFQEMARYAGEVPFSLEEIQRGSGVLAVVSKDAEELARLMKITGNVAAITGLDFKTTAEQIQRSMSAGISAADLFRDKGVKGMLGFKAGAVVSIKETSDAFDKFFGAGGKFGKATDELATTLEGTQSMIGDTFLKFKLAVLDSGFFDELKIQFGLLDNFLKANMDTIKELGKNIGQGLASAVRGTVAVLIFFKNNMTAIVETVKILIAFKLVAFFYNLTTAIKGTTIAMALFNKITKKNILIGGAALLISQLDKIIKKIKEIRGITGDEKGDVGLPDTGTTVSKEIPESTFMQKLMLQVEIFRNILTSTNENELQTMKDGFFTIGETIAKNINEGIKKVSKSIAESIIMGKELSDIFKKISQELGIKILAYMIELTARLFVDYTLQKLKQSTLEKQTDEMRKQTKEQEKQNKAKGTAMLMSGNPMGFLGFMASGGAVGKGQPYMVGENGPELFVPNQSGQIQQNARGGSGGGSTTVNFNINTLDASGFEDLLVRSRGTITQLINSAVNERGSKNLI